jgi:glyoxylase-like metal-dependent hydrolase (beta-lactamase superfamily II)
MNHFLEPISEEYKNISFIRGARGGKYPYSHSILLEDFLVDTGISSRILRKVKRLHPINNVLISHWHEDHTSGNRLLTDAKFYIHPKDKFLIENVDKFNEYYGISNTPAEEEFEWFMEGIKLVNIKVDNLLEDSQIINVGNEYEIKVIHTPGHTAGHCAFLELNSKIAFLADIDLTNFVFYAGIDSNLIDFEESIEKLMKVDMEMVVTGHRGVIKGKKVIKQELNKYLSIIHKRDQRILSHLSEKKPMKVIDFKKRNFIYKYYGLFKEYEIIAEIIMIQNHFDKFLKEKMIEQKGNGYVLS